MILTAILSILVDLFLYSACALTVIMTLSAEQRPVAALIAAVPFLLYMGLLVKEKRYYLDQESARKRLRAGGVLLGIIVFLLFVFQKMDIFGSYFLPLFLCWLFTELFLLQILRHRESGALKPRFYLIIFGILGSVFLIAFIFTSQAVRRVVGQGIGWAYRNVIARVMIGLFYGVVWAVTQIARLIAMLFSSGKEETQQQKTPLQQQAEEFLTESFEEQGLPAWVTILFGLLLILLVVWIVVKVVRYLVSGRERAAFLPETVFERTRIAKAGTSRPAGNNKNKKGNRYAIRHAYRKYLRKSRKAELFSPKQAAALEKGTACSLDLMLQGEAAEKDAIERLRACYLPARYSEIEPLTNTAAEGAVQAEKEITRTFRNN